MKRFAYFTIWEEMSPKDAADILLLAKESGYDSVIVLNPPGAELTGRYREMLLSVLRAAYRHKVNIYLSDDSGMCAGTGFGQLCSVKDVRKRALRVKKAENVQDDDTLLCEKDGKCVVAEFVNESGNAYMSVPDLTLPECALMVQEVVYTPLMRELSKFARYELKGFVCRTPHFDKKGEVPYSKAALEMYREKHGEPDLFKLARSEETEEYFDCILKCTENNFLKPLADFAKGKGLEFVLTAETCCSLREFCEKENVPLIAPDGEFVFADESFDALDVYQKGSQPVVQIKPGMDRAIQIENVFKKHPEAVCVSCDEPYNDRECIVITNPSDKELTLGFLLEGDRLVYDWDNDCYYAFEKRWTYTVFPKSFLCVVKKDNAYADSLPVRVGGVLCGTLTDEKKLDFTIEDGVYTFRLPEEELYKSCIYIKGSFENLQLKMGGRIYPICGAPFAAELFNFLSGNVAEAVCDGHIDEIIIAKKGL